MKIVYLNLALFANSSQLKRLLRPASRLGCCAPYPSVKNLIQDASGTVAERERFELSYPVRDNTLSRRAPSTTQPPLRLN